MKNLLPLIAVIFLLSSCSLRKTSQFGKTSDDISFQSSVNSEDKVINVFTDTSYVSHTNLTLFKELVYSDGDTTFINEYELIIVNGIEYMSPDTATWVNYKIMEVYK
jgi:hypothetical protein